MISTDAGIEIERTEFYFAPMTEHDLLEVVEIEEQTGLSRWGWEAYHTELRHGSGSLMMVARPRSTASFDPRQRVAGFVASRLSGEELHINNIAVRPAFRRLGIAHRLLQEVLRAAAHAGGTTALLEVRLSNEAAQKLYGKCGFRVIARRASYYTQPPEDALLMKAELKA